MADGAANGRRDSCRSPFSAYLHWEAMRFLSSLDIFVWDNFHLAFPIYIFRLNRKSEAAQRARNSVLPFYNGVLTDLLIAILQLCRARVTDDGEVRISISYTTTKVLFNYECHEFFTFKERFFTPIRSIISTSRITGSRLLEAMSNKNMTVTSWKDIHDNKKVGEFWVVGEIIDIERDWYFTACKIKSCGKKLQYYMDKMYWVIASELKEKYYEDSTLLQASIHCQNEETNNLSSHRNKVEATIYSKSRTTMSLHFFKLQFTEETNNFSSHRKKEEATFYSKSRDGILFQDDRHGNEATNKVSYDKERN
nr:replication protein A 70 kDa DNA-binding subunit B-like [Ipomoea batatas]